MHQLTRNNISTPLCVDFSYHLVRLIRVNTTATATTVIIPVIRHHEREFDELDSSNSRAIGPAGLVSTKARSDAMVLSSHSAQALLLKLTTIGLMIVSHSRLQVHSLHAVFH